MITHLSIRGLAIIEELVIDFSPQLNVITGETGAGKSILIKALHFLLGSKADSDVIRKGFERAHVGASFLLPKTHPSIVIIRDHGLTHEDSDLSELIIRREINVKGRSQAWINDQPISSSFLREVGQALIDIYGQHENHRMLDPSSHMEYIDQFLKDPSLPSVFSTQMQKIHSLMTELRAQIEQYKSKRREQDYLQFRYEEISQLDPSVEDYQATNELCIRASRALSEQKMLSHAQGLCDEGYKGRPLSSAVHELIKVLESSRWLSEEKDFHQYLESLKSLVPSLDEFSFFLGRVAERNSVDESEIESSQERLALYQSFFRKLGVRSIDEMMTEFSRLEKELSFVLEAPDALSERLDQIVRLAKEAEATVRVLTDARQKAASKAVSLVVKELQDLNMKGAQIQFEFQSVKQALSSVDISDFSQDFQSKWAYCADFLATTSKSGREKGQFQLAANPGEGFKPLAKVASGGEISRIMLGFKKALSVGAHTCVMVFDEIDTGISGHTAHIVGRKLKDLSEKFQVICISHLPQVAVYGDSHFKVEKRLTNKTTESRIFRLSQEKSEEEIARLLSGDKVTSSSLTHARQLIKAARSNIRKDVEGRL